jgi:hypothetical protein
MAELLCPYQDQVQRLAEVPGLGVDSAQQILAEVGPTAAPFPSAGQRLLGGRLPRRERERGGELQSRVRYEERGPALSQKSKRHRTARMIRAHSEASAIGSNWPAPSRRLLPRSAGIFDPESAASSSGRLPHLHRFLEDTQVAVDRGWLRTLPAVRAKPGGNLSSG